MNTELRARRSENTFKFRINGTTKEFNISKLKKMKKATVYLPNKWGKRELNKIVNYLNSKNINFVWNGDIYGI